MMEQYTVGHFYDNWITTVGIDFRSKILTIAEKQVKIQVILLIDLISQLADRN
jgi:hypothetical protein